MQRGEWPRVIVVADGSCGDSCSVLGISTDYIVESCRAYGANATIERLDQRQVRCLYASLFRKPMKSNLEFCCF